MAEADAAVSICARHPGERSTFTCARCGSFACALCRPLSGGADRCAACVARNDSTPTRPSAFGVLVGRFPRLACLSLLQVVLVTAYGVWRLLGIDGLLTVTSLHGGGFDRFMAGTDLACAAPSLLGALLLRSFYVQELRDGFIGRQRRLREVLLSGLRALPATLITSTLEMVLTLLGAAAFVIPALLPLVALGPMSAAVGVGDDGVRAALRDWWRVVRAHFFAVLGAELTGTVIVIFLCGGAAFAKGVLSMVGGMQGYMAGYVLCALVFALAPLPLYAREVALFFAREQAALLK